MSSGNVFANVPDGPAEELVEELAGSRRVRVERIVSRGHASPPGFWYDQKDDEFVVLLSGAARITFEGAPAPVHLAPGDWLSIPARSRHRVDWTDPDTDSVWLAVHFPAAPGAGTTSSAPRRRRA